MLFRSMDAAIESRYQQLFKAYPYTQSYTPAQLGVWFTTKIATMSLEDREVLRNHAMLRHAGEIDVTSPAPLGQPTGNQPPKQSAAPKGMRQ